MLNDNVYVILTASEIISHLNHCPRNWQLCIIWRMWHFELTKYLFTKLLTSPAADDDIKIIIFSSTNIEKPEFCVDHISISVLHTD